MNKLGLAQKDTKISYYSKITEISKNNSLLDDLSSDCSQCFGNQETRMKYKKGEIIMLDYQSRGIFYVLSGLVKLSMQDVNGNELIVSIKKPGDVFAESCLFNNDINTYPLTATMFQDGEILFYNSNFVESELKLCPYLSEKIIECMSKQIEEISSRLFEMAHLDTFSKTIKTLEKLIGQFGKYNLDSIYIDLPITIQEFAGFVGTSRESVSRIFSELKKNRLIEIKEKKIFIMDLEKFRNLC